MLRRYAPALAIPVFLSLVALPPSTGWGDNAERLIANKAIDTLPDEIRPWFESNRQFILAHLSDPEAAEAKSPSARRNGYIRLDHYGPFPYSALPRDYKAAVQKYGKRTIDNFGLLPWQVGVSSKGLTDALHDHLWGEAKVHAAALAHYVSEAHDPFNTTTNFDGHLSDQIGVDQRFSNGLIEHYQLFFFVHANDATFIKDPTDHAFEMVLSAHSWLEVILLADLRADLSNGIYNSEYYDRFYSLAGTVLVRQLTDATTDVGSYWLTAWVNAGRPPLPPQ
jgi:hypothetical protein